MSGILKKSTILVLTVLLPLTTVLTACNDGKGGDGTTPGGDPPTSQVTPSTPTPGPTDPVTPPVVEKVPVEQIEAFIKLLDSNYTYAILSGFGWGACCPVFHSSYYSVMPVPSPVALDF